MINKEFFAALDDLQTTKGVDKEAFMETLESALTSAYKKNSGESAQVIVKINPEKKSIKCYAIKTVVMEVKDKDKEISLDEARLIKKSVKLGEIMQNEIIPKNFGRIAAQTAKQVILQRLRDMERSTANIQYQEKENELITCLIHRIEGDTVYVEIAQDAEGILGPKDQIANEKYNINDRIKVYVKKVRSTPKGPQILVSRSHAGFVKRLFENEVPEIRQGVVQIKSMARDAGGRTKMAVFSTDEQVDAVGACVGAKGTRVNAVVRELGGEKVDIIEWCENPAEYIARALSPAKVLLVEVDPEDSSSKVIVPDDMLSLTIGKDGQNVRLAAKLTGWKIDVKPKSRILEAGLTEDGDEEDEEQYEEAGYDFSDEITEESAIEAEENFESEPEQDLPDEITEESAVEAEENFESEPEQNPPDENTEERTEDRQDNFEAESDQAVSEE